MTMQKLKENKVLYFFWSLFSYFFRKITIYKRIFSNLYFCLIYFRSFRVVLLNDLTIGLERLYQSKVYFPHPVGIVIGKGVKIGNNCTIYQNVTIGAKTGIGDKYPTLGNNITVYANTCIIGDVTIGDNAIIGACSLVLQDIPANVIAVGNPAKVIAYV